MNQTNDFRLLIDVLRNPRAFHEYDYSYINFYLLFEFILIIVMLSRLYISIPYL